jgi:hypothetical protein
MWTIRDAQMAVLARIGEREAEERALKHLRGSAPQTCDSMPDAALRAVVARGHARARHYGFHDEYDFFRYLNLMFVLGFEFDTDARYPWAARALNRQDLAGRVKMDALMDRALLYCSTSPRERTA